MKNLFSTKKSKIWLSITSVLLVILIGVNVAATRYLSGLMDAFFGGARQVKNGDSVYYIPDEDVTDKASALSKANALVEEICEEGTILLKNENQTLPLSEKDTKKISVFGNNSINLVYGSSGSVGGDCCPGYPNRERYYYRL